MTAQQQFNPYGEEGASQAQIVQIDSSKHVAVVVICAVLCTFSAVMSFWAWKEAYNAATESRLVQYYLMDPHSRTPDELSAWSKFNKEHEKER